MNYLFYVNEWQNFILYNIIIMFYNLVAEAEVIITFDLFIPEIFYSSTFLLVVVLIYSKEESTNFIFSD